MTTRLDKELKRQVTVDGGDPGAAGAEAPALITTQEHPMQQTAMSRLHGGCRCGAVRYTLAMDVLPRTYACHCRDCQTWSGSAFSQQTYVPEAALEVTGPTVIYELTNASGRISTQRMCGVCHARIYNTNSAGPGVAVVRAGTLDHSDALEVTAHIWVKRKQPWLMLSDAAPAWEEGAPMTDLLQALAPR